MEIEFYLFLAGIHTTCFLLYLIPLKKDIRKIIKTRAVIKEIYSFFMDGCVTIVMSW